MKKNVLKNKYFILIILLIIIAIPWLFFTLLSSNNSKPPVTINKTPIPTSMINLPKSHPQIKARLDHIKPGSATDKDVIRLLGTPNNTKNVEGHEIMTYSLPSTNRENNIYLNNGTVEYIFEEIPEDNAFYNQYLNKGNLSKPETVLYDNYSGAGFNWQVFYTEGVAFLANPVNGYTIKIIYFKPMDYNTFISTTAKTFSLSTDKKDDREKFSPKKID